MPLTSLQKHDYDPDRAVGAYFEDPDGALKEDTVSRQWQYQDNIPCTASRWLS